MRATLSTAVFEQGPIVARICAHLETLPNVVTLSCCSKLLQTRVRQCFPELVIISDVWRKLPWWIDVTKALLQCTANNDMTWHYCIDATYWWSDARQFVALLFDAKAWHVLELLFCYVQRKGRTHMVMVGGILVEISECHYYWFIVVLEAMRHFEDAWVNRGSDALAKVYHDATQFKSIAAWHDYQSWYTHTCIPAVREEAKAVVERRNVEFLRELLKQQME